MHNIRTNTHGANAGKQPRCCAVADDLASFFVLFFLRRCFDAAAVKSGASAALPTTLAKRTLGLAKCGKRRLGKKKKKTVTLHLGQKNTISCRTIGDRPESRSKIASAVAAGLAMAIHKRYAKAPAGASGTPKRPVTGSQTIGKRRKNRETSERATQRAAVDDSRATRPNRSASQ